MRTKRHIFGTSLQGDSPKKPPLAPQCQAQIGGRGLGARRCNVINRVAPRPVNRLPPQFRMADWCLGSGLVQVNGSRQELQERSRMRGDSMIKPKITIDPDKKLMIGSCRCGWQHEVSLSYGGSEAALEIDFVFWRHRSGGCPLTAGRLQLIQQLRGKPPLTT